MLVAILNIQEKKSFLTNLPFTFPFILVKGEDSVCMTSCMFEKRAISM